MPTAPDRQRVLFVDDEELVLRGLHRILHGHERHWDMVFETSGHDGLQVMAKGRFDVVISDMRMPGMNGAQFLAEVARLYPQTIRIALSGYADREVILECLNNAHQYLTKPCDARMLENVLLRLTELVRSGKGALIRQVLARCTELPSVPDLYSEIVELVGKPDCVVDDIGAIVSQDPAMSTQVLKLVNSAFFGLGRKISEPNDAVLFLGVDTIKSLVLGAHLFQPTARPLPAAFSLPRLWAHCVACADASKKIALSLGANHATANEAYLAGLLHDIGKLLLNANLPLECEEIVRLYRAGPLPLVAAESKVLGVNHAELGGYFLGLLGLPVAVVEAVTHHHEPHMAVDPSSLVLASVHVGNAVACNVRPADSYPVPSSLDVSFLKNRGIEGDLANWGQVLGGWAMEANTR